LLFFEDNKTRLALEKNSTEL